MKTKAVVLFLAAFLEFQGCGLYYLEPQDSKSFEDIYLDTNLASQTVFEPLALKGDESHGRKVRQGDMVSMIVRDALFECLSRKGLNYADYDIREAVSSIKATVQCKSGNPNLIYPGEMISFEIPREITIYRAVQKPILPRQYYGLQALERELGRLVWKFEYKRGYFDCSNRSAALALYLSKLGYHVVIAEGQKYGGNHSWIRVESLPGQWVDVESNDFTVDFKSPIPSRTFSLDKAILSTSEYSITHLHQPILARRSK